MLLDNSDGIWSLREERANFAGTSTTEPDAAFVILHFIHLKA